MSTENSHENNNVSDSPRKIIRLAKTEWPELVGLTFEEAEKKIKEETEGVKIIVVYENEFVIADYRTDRVWLYVDGAGKIIRMPRIG